MSANPFTNALKAKGLSDLYHRSLSITRRYGLNTGIMDQAMRCFSEVLQRFDCGATFPITAVTLKRHGATIEKYLHQNIEFAVHGYTHVNYAQLSPDMQLAHLQQALEVFARAGIKPAGFRSPYLSQDDHLYAAIEAAGFSYVSNQPILWDAVDKGALAPATLARYERALAYYQPWQSKERLSLPRQEKHLVEIPVSLPDDEILIERLGGEAALIADTWRRILSLSYQRGELFGLQLHPERIALCADALSAVLAEARALSPKIWCARLDEISAWWKARSNTGVEVCLAEDGSPQCAVSGPAGMTVLGRGVEVDAPSSPWTNGYREIKAVRFKFSSSRRPFIGLSPSAAPSLARFLRQQGYIVETSPERINYSYYIDQTSFDVSQEQSLSALIEGSNCPLLKLGRWPNGAQSALAITGDIDALTLWDYGLRMIGK
jgi:peptidoglycan/xylan/chitin deacetylase (PgdA/CDA1 family)